MKINNKHFEHIYHLNKRLELGIAFKIPDVCVAKGEGISWVDSTAKISFRNPWICSMINDSILFFFITQVKSIRGQYSAPLRWLWNPRSHVCVCMGTHWEVCLLLVVNGAKQQQVKAVCVVLHCLQIPLAEGELIPTCQTNSRRWSAAEASRAGSQHRAGTCWHPEQREKSLPGSWGRPRGDEFRREKRWILHRQLCVLQVFALFIIADGKESTTQRLKKGHHAVFSVFTLGFGACNWIPYMWVVSLCISCSPLP